MLSTRYPNTCYQTHLLSTQFRSHSFAIRPQLLSTHLLSSLTCSQANLLSILKCNQQFCYQSSFAIKFLTSSQSLLLPFFPPKNLQKKWKNFSTFGILHSLANFAWAWNRLISLPQVKVSTF